MGIRPEDLSLATDEDKLTVGGKVFLSENFGRELLLSIKVNGSDETLRILIDPDCNFKQEEIKLALNPQRIHWFDAQTGDRLIV
jgi:multiple sugar transport system ATP-binding protein